MSTTPEVLLVLKSIDHSLKELVAIARQKRGGAASSQQAVASPRDLDGKYGDPEIKFEPRDWQGDSCKGLHMSQCPAEFLDLIAETFDYFAQKAAESNELTSSGKPVADYKRKDAARARGWAARIRTGWTSQPANGHADSDWAQDDF